MANNTEGRRVRKYRTNRSKLVSARRASKSTIRTLDGTCTIYGPSARMRTRSTDSPRSARPRPMSSIAPLRTTAPKRSDEQCYRPFQADGDAI